MKFIIEVSLDFNQDNPYHPSSTKEAYLVTVSNERIIYARTTDKVDDGNLLRRK